MIVKFMSNIFAFIYYIIMLQIFVCWWILLIFNNKFIEVGIGKEISPVFEAVN